MGNPIAEALVRNRMRKRVNESVGETAPTEYIKKAENILNHKLYPFETGITVTDAKIIDENPKTVTMEVSYEVHVQIPQYDSETSSVYYENDTEYFTRIMSIEKTDEE